MFDCGAAPGHRLEPSAARRRRASARVKKEAATGGPHALGVGRIPPLRAGDRGKQHIACGLWQAQCLELHLIAEQHQIALVGTQRVGLRMRGQHLSCSVGAPPKAAGLGLVLIVGRFTGRAAWSNVNARDGVLFFVLTATIFHKVCNSVR